MRISDWSSDVCSSDLHRPLADGARRSCPADVLRDRHPPLVAERRLEAPKAREQGGGWGAAADAPATGMRRWFLVALGVALSGTAPGQDAEEEPSNDGFGLSVDYAELRPRGGNGSRSEEHTS